MSIENALMVFLFMILDAPSVRTFVRAHFARELRLGVHALELSVPPKRSVNRVSLPAVDANETSLPFSLLIVPS